MDINSLGSLGELIAALATVLTLIYLSIQIRQTNMITRARFGHEITERTYERYFQSAKDNEFSQFLAKDWAKEELDPSETQRVLNFSVMLLVDLFDIYDKVEQGLVEVKHLEFRAHVLRTGIFRSPLGLRAWNFWKVTRQSSFVEWFEKNIIDQKEIEKLFNEMNKDDPKWVGKESISFRIDD
tara:strand:+ start:345 stop:893 length:549 start_codon:yes stop_codon:yes gene_type:complete